MSLAITSTVLNDYSHLSQKTRQASPREWKVIHTALNFFLEDGYHGPTNAGTLFSSISSKGHYEIIEVLGKGATGLVVLLEKNGQHFALKIARKQEDNSYLLREAGNNLHLHHLAPENTLPLPRIYPNIRLDSHSSEHRVGLLYPYGGPTLFTHFVLEPQPPQATQKDFVVLVTKGLQFLQTITEKGLTLGDLKTDNILWNKQKNNLSFIDNCELEKVGDPLPSQYIGTRNFRSPTILTGKYSPSQATFAFGCTLYECLTRHFLFKTPINLTQNPELSTVLHLSQVFLLIPPSQEFLEQIPEDIRKKLFTDPTNPTTFKSEYATDSPNSKEKFQKRFDFCLKNAVCSESFELTMYKNFFIQRFTQFLLKCLDYNNPILPSKLLQDPFVKSITEACKENL